MVTDIPHLMGDAYPEQYPAGSRQKGIIAGYIGDQRKAKEWLFL